MAAPPGVVLDYFMKPALIRLQVVGSAAALAAGENSEVLPAESVAVTVMNGPVSPPGLVKVKPPLPPEVVVPS